MHNIFNTGVEYMAYRSEGSKEGWHKLDQEATFDEVAEKWGQWSLVSGTQGAYYSQDGKTRFMKNGLYNVALTDGSGVLEVVTGIKRVDEILAPSALTDALEAISSKFDYAVTIGQTPRWWTMTFDLGDFTLFDDGNEKHQNKLTFVLEYNKGISIRALETLIRVVCQNTLNAALMGADADSVIRIRGNNKQEQLSLLGDVYDVALSNRESAEEFLKAMAQRSLGRKAFEDFLVEAFTPSSSRSSLATVAGLATEYNLDIPEVLSERLESATTKRKKDVVRAAQGVSFGLKLYDRYEKSTSGYANSMWAAYNAVTHINSHGTGKGHGSALTIRKGNTAYKKVASGVLRQIESPSNIAELFFKIPEVADLL